MTNEYTTVDRIIAKLDNDFNPNNSDWIPRVGAWIHDALMQLDCIIIEEVKKKLIVKDRIARSDCELGENVKLYDCNGCEIIKLDSVGCGCNGLQDGSLGSEVDDENLDNNSNDNNLDNGVDRNYYHTDDKPITHRTVTERVNRVNETIQNVAFHVNVPVPYPPRYNVIEVKRKGGSCVHGYVRLNPTTFELNFDTNYVIVKYNAPKQMHCTVYGCTSPAIPNNGKLIEAITYYCMYKMLTRGYVHPVMNLAASQYGTNPYYIWMQSKEEAKRSVINDGMDENLDDLWRSAFYINTFNPRGKS